MLEQPKLWTELQAGIECLTQLLALLEAMAGSSDGANTGSEELHEAAVLLQQQLVYNGQVLDAALDALRAYKDGTQSLAFLRAGVHLAYAVMRMLEKWARTTGEGSYVRKRAKPKPKRKRVKATGTVFFLQLPRTYRCPRFIYLARNADGSGVPDADVEPEEEGEDDARAQHEDDVIDETIFTFESFELVSECKKRATCMHARTRVSVRVLTKWPPPEIRKFGHYPVAANLPGPLQRIHIARRDETCCQSAASAGGPREG